MKNAVTITYPNKTTVLVDPEDVQLALKYGWCNSRGYVVRSVCHSDGTPGKRRILGMHKEILGVDAKTHVDHINTVKHDNRRANLRVCSKSENGMNRGLNRNNATGYKGVSHHKASSKFVATIMKDGKYQYLGLFTTAEEAHAAYCKAGRELHGEFFNPG